MYPIIIAGQDINFPSASGAVGVECGSIIHINVRLRTGAARITAAFQLGCVFRHQGVGQMKLPVLEACVYARIAIDIDPGSSK